MNYTCSFFKLIDEFSRVLEELKPPRSNILFSANIFGLLSEKFMIFACSISLDSLFFWERSSMLFYLTLFEPKNWFKVFVLSTLIPIINFFASLSKLWMRSCFLWDSSSGFFIFSLIFLTDSNSLLRILAGS